jgi:hypothetical protein
VSHGLAGRPEKRDVFKFFLHDPLEVDADPAIQDVDVVKAGCRRPVPARCAGGEPGACA